jgi:hypothetical protein
VFGVMFSGARGFGVLLAGARVRRVLLLAGLVLVALPAGSALAKTIGRTGGKVGCPAESAYGDTNYVVPSGGGTITSFSFRSDSSNTGGQLVFFVLRPAGSGSYKVVGKTGLVTLAGTGLETFPANISVRAGDILGFWPKGQVGFSNCARKVSSGGGYIQSAITTNPKVGDTIAFPLTASFFDLNESATFYRHPFTVYAGYADSFRKGRPKAPSPWRGSPNVVFKGCNYFSPSRCPTGVHRYDAGAFRLDNRTSQAMTVTKASVTIGSCTFKPWPGLDVTVPATSS